MKFKLQMSRAASLSGVFLGVISFLILLTSFFSFLERESTGILVLIVLMAMATLATTGYLVYTFRRSGD